MTILVPAALAFTLVQPTVPTSTLAHLAGATTLRDAIAQQHVAPTVVMRHPRFGTAAPQASSSFGRKIAFTVTGVLAGFLAGAAAGGAIDHAIGCNCDDPGLRGAVLGGFGGAAAGATLGMLLAR